MAQTKNCILCLGNEQKRLLNVCCENNETPNKTRIITKHLGLDLKITPQALVCVECWESVYDFHLFYCKVQTIHNEEYTEFDTVGKIADANTKDEQGCEVESFLGGTVKAEPLEVQHDRDDTESEYIGSSYTQPSGADDDTGNRPRRRIKPPERFKPDPSDMMRFEGKLPFVEVDVMATDDDEGDRASVGTNYLDGAQSNTDTEAVVVVPPKKRRGRPPKNQKTVVQDEKPPKKNAVTRGRPPNAAVEPPKKRRGRPPKYTPLESEAPAKVPKAKATKTRTRKSINDLSTDSEQDVQSDFETSVSLWQWKAMGGKPEDFKGKMETSSHSGKKRIFGPEGRDERLFAYIDEFVCEYCPEKVQFDRFIEATRHYRDVHMERAYLKCPKCDKKTYTSGEFVSHVETHNDPDRCKCTICGKMTLSKVALKKHMRCHQLDLEENNPFPCRLCSRRFEAEYKRDKHELLHRPKPIIPKQYGRDEAMLEFYQRIYCDLCEEEKPDSTSFDNFWDLKVHMNRQHEKAPYLKCPICSKKMGVRHQIMMHIDVHKNPELYRCEVCNEIHQYLDRHMISAHTPSTAAPEKKRYNCEQCGKVFKFRWKLKYHINEAHGVKDVSCDICKKFFTRPALAAHKRKAHIEGEASFLCDHCPKMFNKQQTLRMHIAVAHENRRKHKKCNLCGKEVTGMTKHMQMVHPSEGPVSCDLCGKNFRSPFHMKRHRLNTCEATMNDRPYKCEVCGKGFSLKLTMTEHMTTHTRTNLYQCAFCLKTYGYLSNLQKHRKKAHPQEWREVKGDQSIVTVIPLSAPVVAPATEYQVPVSGQ